MQQLVWSLEYGEWESKREFMKEALHFFFFECFTRRSVAFNLISRRSLVIITRFLRSHRARGTEGASKYFAPRFSDDCSYCFGAPPSYVTWMQPRVHDPSHHSNFSVSDAERQINFPSWPMHTSYTRKFLRFFKCSSNVGMLELVWVFFIEVDPWLSITYSSFTPY